MDKVYRTIHNKAVGAFDAGSEHDGAAAKGNGGGASDPADQRNGLNAADVWCEGGLETPIIAGFVTLSDANRLKRNGHSPVNVEHGWESGAKKNTTARLIVSLAAFVGLGA